MIVVVLVLAVALLVGAGVLALTDRARRRSLAAVRQMRHECDERAAQAEAERDEAVAARQEAEAEQEGARARLEEAEARADAAETRLAEMGQPTSAPVARTGGTDRGLLDTLWAVTTLRAAWDRRRAGALSTAPTADEDDPLTRVLVTEVERLRDDSGIPGSLRVAVEPAATPPEAVAVAASATALLATLARWCDAYDLLVHRWEGRITAVVVCEGFSGPDSVADETSELLAAVTFAGGDLDVDRDIEGRLRARLSLPVGER